MCDDVFDDDSDEKVLRIQELERIQRSRKLEGYREGVIAGKELSLQGGFDEGFKDAVATMSRLGKLQGMLSALLTYQGSCKGQMMSPADLREIESFQQEVTQFQDRTRFSIKTAVSRLPVQPTDKSVDEFPMLSAAQLYESTLGDEGSTSVSGTTPLVALTEGRVNTLRHDSSRKEDVSNIKSCATSEKTISMFVAPLGDCQQKSSPAEISSEADHVIVPTKDNAKYHLNTVQIQMKQMNYDSVDLIKLMFLEKKCNIILEKFGLNDACI